jgi:hypothetical protein
MNFSGYLALGNMDVSGLVFTEMSGAPGYARQAVTLRPAGAGTVINPATIDFPIATRPYTWPSFRAYGIYDAVSAGNLLMAWSIGNSIVVVAGRHHRVLVGDIELNFPVVTSTHGTEVVMAMPLTVSPDRIIPGLPTLSITQAAYDALPVKDPTTLYIIVG